MLAFTLAGCTEPRFEPLSAPDASASEDGGSRDGALDGGAPDGSHDGQPFEDAMVGPAPAQDGDASGLPDVDAAGDAGSEDPHTGSDAGRDHEALPAAAEKLLGHHLARSYGFWVDDSGAKVLVDELAIAEFAQVDDHVELSMRICRQSTRSGGISMDLSVPSSHPVLRRRVSFDADGFHTDDHPITTGFVRDSVEACDGNAGELVPRASWQVWLASQCRCPVSPAAPPTLEDCRVTDEDRDRAPALSYRWSALGWISHLATIVRSHHVGGRETGMGKHFAAVKLDEVGYQLSCAGPGCIDYDRHGRPCTSEHNGTEFVALAGAEPATFTCEMAVAQEASFFQEPIPAAPAQCARDVLTDDPMRP